MLHWSCWEWRPCYALSLPHPDLCDHKLLLPDHISVLYIHYIYDMNNGSTSHFQSAFMSQRRNMIHIKHFTLTITQSMLFSTKHSKYYDAHLLYGFLMPSFTLDLYTLAPPHTHTQPSLLLTTVFECHSTSYTCTWYFHWSLERHIQIQSSTIIQ